MIFNTTIGYVLSTSVIVPGYNYSSMNEVPTFVLTKNGITNTNTIISNNILDYSIGPYKVDNLCVDISVNTSGSIISAVPSTLYRGQYYTQGTLVSVRNSNSNNINDIAILSIDYVS